VDDKAALEKFLIRASEVLYPDKKPHVISVTSKNCDDDTPLHIAAQWGDRKACQMLVEEGADVNALGDMSCTPLHNAVGKNHVLVVEYLLDAGANPDLISELNYSPRKLAEERNQKEILKLLKQWRPVKKTQK
jgi:uncharacterized protein